jgi:hypothetical protein
MANFAGWFRMPLRYAALSKALVRGAPANSAHCQAWRFLRLITRDACPGTM